MSGVARRRRMSRGYGDSLVGGARHRSKSRSRSKSVGRHRSKSRSRSKSVGRRSVSRRRSMSRHRSSSRGRSLYGGDDEWGYGDGVWDDVKDFIGIGEGDGRHRPTLKHKAAAKVNPWLDFLRRFRKAHPELKGLPQSEIAKMAKGPYRNDRPKRGSYVGGSPLY